MSIVQNPSLKPHGAPLPILHEEVIMGKTFEEIQKENDEWARQNPAPSAMKPPVASSGAPRGLFNYARDFLAFAESGVRRAGRAGAAIIRPVATAVCFVAPFAEPLARWTYKIAMTSKGADGKRHFSPKRAAISVAIGVCLAVASPFLVMGFYYYGTLRDMDNVYVPDAAVFVNQQFEAANLPGRHVTSRDEIYTVMGRWLQPDGVVEPVRFDIDMNAYFPEFGATMRPDLAAAKLNSQSPYGIKAKLKVTGFYATLPRFIRFKIVRWFNLRCEIVEVLDVKELTSMPSFVTTVDGSGVSANLSLGAPAKSQPLPPLPPPQAALPTPAPKL
jgi:hypothetical protein